jgi:hypothetical protein
VFQDVEHVDTLDVEDEVLERDAAVGSGLRVVRAKYSPPTA